MIAALLLSLASAGETSPPMPATAIAVAPAVEAAPELVVLLEAMRPRARAIETEIALFDNGAASMFGNSEEDKELNAKYPQFREKLIEALRAVVIARAPASEDMLRAQLLTILARELSPAEVRDLTNFYVSPAGAAIVEQMNRAVGQLRGEQVSEMLMKDRVRKSDIDKMRTEAAKGVSLTGRQEAALLEFMKTPTWKVLNRLQPKLLAAQVAFTNAPDPETEAQMEQASNKVIKEVIGIEP